MRLKTHSLLLILIIVIEVVLLNFLFYRDNSPESARAAAFSPTPPCKPRKKSTPTRTRRSFQSPPVSPCYEDYGDNRPHTVAQMRSDRTEKEKDRLINSMEVTDDVIKEDEETFYNT